MRSRGLREKRIKTVLGDIRFRRSLFICPECGASRLPGDELLDVVGTVFSPGTRRLMARAGQGDTFREGAGDLREFAAIEVTAKDVERISEGVGEEVERWHERERAGMLEDKEGAAETDVSERPSTLYICYDGTGVPMVPWETLERKGKQADGTSRTREAKLGCVFTQTGVDDNGHAIRDEGSTTFVGAIESSKEFGDRIYAEALRRGLNRAAKIAVIGDGAKYNWEIAAMHFPQATHIVDLYHAKEHLYALCEKLVPEGEKEFEYLNDRWSEMLEEGDVESIIKEAEAKMPKSGSRRKAIMKDIVYFQNNLERMRYGDYFAQGLFVGSGVVEAGCKTIIGKRLKQSGMEWTVRGANSIIALRCCHLSGRMEEFWEQRVA
jgi:hypothetical protein